MGNSFFALFHTIANLMRKVSQPSTESDAMRHSPDGASARHPFFFGVLLSVVVIFGFCIAAPPLCRFLQYNTKRNICGENFCTLKICSTQNCTARSVSVRAHGAAAAKNKRSKMLRLGDLSE